MAEEWSWARRMAQPFLESLAQTDLSGASILDLLRGEGLGYKTGSFYEDLRRLRDQIRYQSLVERLRPESYVPRSWMQEVPEEVWHIGVNYRAEMKVWFRDPDTGDVFSKWYSPGLEAYETVEEMKGWAEATLPWSDYEPEMEFLSIDLIGLSHLEGAPY